jgi:hypothetical protein
MNDIGKWWIFPAWATMALLALLCAAAAEQSIFFGKVDTELRMAIESSSGPKMVQHLNLAEELLAASNRERRSSQSGTDLEVNARAALIDAMRNVSELEKAGNTLESVRAMSKVLELTRSLADMASMGKAGKSRELDELVAALYRHLQQLAASDRNAPVAFSPAPREALLFRIFTLSGKTQLAAFELWGNAALRSAVWRETQFPTSPQAARAAVDGFLHSSEGKAEKRAEQPAFIILLSGALAMSDFGVEQQMQRTARELLRRGIVLIVLTSKELDRPYTLLPAIDRTDAFADLKGADAILIYRRTGSELYRWNKLSSAADLDRAAAVAQEIAAELDQDVEPGRTPPSLGPADLKQFLPAPPRRQIDSKKQFAVTEPTRAAVVDARDRISLKPTTPLVLAAAGPGGWGQYELQDTNEVVWLRTSQVAPFKAEPKEMGGEADKKTPEKDKREPGLWERLHLR